MSLASANTVTKIADALSLSVKTVSAYRAAYWTRCTSTITPN
ncbi:MAG: hypothetical protein WA632_11160 [Gallionella sp.]